MSQPLPQEPEDSSRKGGFGSPIRKETPKPTSASKPSGAYGVTTGADGMMRTTKDNLPKFTLDDAMEIWAQSHNADVGQDFA